MIKCDNLIVGSGIQALALAEYFFKNNKDYLIISGDRYFPKASTRPMIINCLRGIERGVSVLGDLHLDAWKEFESYFAQNPHGIYSTKESIIWRKGHPFARRFQKNENYNQIVFDAYIMQGNLFINHLKEKHQNFVIDDYYKGHEKKNDLKIARLGSHEVNFEKLYLCMGYQLKNTLNNDDFYKPVHGIDLTNQHAIVDESIQNFNIEGINFFVTNNHLVYIGSESSANDFYQPYNERIFRDKIVQRFELLEKVLNRQEHPLSLEKVRNDFLAMKIACSVRAKARKRTPFIKEMEPGIFQLGGLYKSGYLFSFYHAKKILNLV